MITTATVPVATPTQGHAEGPLHVEHLFRPELLAVATRFGLAIPAFCGFVEQVEQSDHPVVEVDPAEVLADDCLLCVTEWLGWDVTGG